MPARSVDHTHQSTLPYGGDPLPLPPGFSTQRAHPLPRPTAIAAAGSALAAARPGGYRAGADDATMVPSAEIATTAVIACRLRIGPMILGTVSMLPLAFGGA